MNFHLKWWSISGIAMLSFAAGCLINSRFLQPTLVRADSNHVFELMIYHAKPGKAANLESIFRDVSGLQAKHDLSVVGYWAPNDDLVGKILLCT
jgi:hypothetical protein